MLAKHYCKMISGKKDLQLVPSKHPGYTEDTKSTSAVGLTATKPLQLYQGKVPMQVEEESANMTGAMDETKLTCNTPCFD